MARKGYKQTEEHKRNLSRALKGKPKSEETKEKMRKPKSTTINMRKPKSTTINMRKAKSEDARKRMSETRKRLFKEGKIILTSLKGMKGQKPWNYIDGRNKLLAPARYGDDWDKIRYLVYLRDKFTCQDCGIIGIRLDIHHKIPFLLSKDNSLNNLITLCRRCHIKNEKINIIKQGV